MASEWPTGQPLSSDLVEVSSLNRTLASMADANAHAAELLVELEITRSELQEKNRTLEQARAAAEESGRYKSLFLANMSHELRTPLSTIIGYSEMILDEPAIAAHPTLVEDVQRIRMAGVHLLTLVNDVLDLSKIEAGGMALDMEDCETLPILHDVIAFARPLMGRNRNHFEVSLPEGEIWIHADRVRVRQCLLNLLSNAAKFTSNGLIRLSVDVHEGMLRCAVQDSGCGIAASDLPLLFQSFVRIARTTHNQPGTGLGLTLTQRMSRLMGGDITVASEAGVGSTFTLTIPLSTTPH